MVKNETHYEAINAFDCKVTYNNLTQESPQNTLDSHMHEECEIYINLSGDVSFVVEENIYPIKPGDIIITRPYEYHHCVYHSDKLHKHFWILFTPAGNEKLLNVFYNRPAGNGNLLTLSPANTEYLIALCHNMSKENDGVTKYSNFFTLISLLHQAEVVSRTNHIYPDDLTYALDYIVQNFAYPISVQEIAQGANVSLNTLERHFAKFFNMSPHVYIQKKRLSHAAMLLSEGATVTEASEKSGFADFSSFISLFKKNYGKTPLKYKQSHFITKSDR